MNSARTCARCNTSLPDDAPDRAICEKCEAEGQATLAEPADFQPPEPAQTPSFTLPPPAAQPSLVGDFEIIDKLGEGGMGAVYRARQKSLDRLVALKILPDHFADDEESIARFQREAKVAASVNHPNLVSVYTCGISEGCHYIAMELVDGENARQRIKRGPIPPDEALRIVGDVCRGLKCGWDSARLIHRDIKPSNIFISSKGEVNLGDLGLAKSLQGHSGGLTETGAAMGTPHYMSPEQVRGEKVLDFRADIYSLGCTLFELLTGRPPYEAPDTFSIINMHLTSPPPAILKVWPECPIPLARLVGRMVKKHYTERQQSYGELIAEIESVRALLASSTTPAQRSVIRSVGSMRSPGASPASAAPLTGIRWTSPAVWLGIAACAFVVVGFGVAIVRISKPHSKPAPSPLAVATPTPVARALTPIAKRLIAPANVPATPLRPPPTAPPRVHEYATTLGTATKERPFLNSLGMEFVPVPIHGQPSSDELGLVFSVWETRVQDYEVFVTETKRAWPKPNFLQSPTHPAVNVSWEDANAFCAWLTDRERKSRKIGTNKVYRLPTDHEWSCAVGLGAREKAATLPKDKSGKIDGVFPWGGDWPPPAKAGNYADESLRKMNPSIPTIDHYDDGTAETAQVGSFRVNELGLYDLGGNVWEWCADSFDGDPQQRVARGSACLVSSRERLLSSNRDRTPAGSRFSDGGFRIVLAFAP